MHRFDEMETMRKTITDKPTRGRSIGLPKLKRWFGYGYRTRRRGNDRICRTIVENTGTAFLLMEQDTTIAMANEQFEKLSGCRRSQVEGRMS